MFGRRSNGYLEGMGHHPENDQEIEKQRDLEAPDPAGNPADHTSPRTKQEPDPERVERGREEFERTIAS